MALGRKTGGRKKGSPNKLTRTLRELLLNALQEAGGQAYLVQQARDNPAAFLALLGRLLPNEIKASVESTTIVVQRSYGKAKECRPCGD